jgi:uncharacterized protein YqeY
MAAATLKDTLRNDMNGARRAGEKGRARLLSTLLSDIRNKEIAVGHQLEDPEVLEVVAKAIKLRNEAAESMAARPEKAELERAEAEMLKAYMPTQLGEEEIREVVAEAIAGGAGDIGALMKTVMPRLKGQADGKEINRIAREELAKGGSGD